MWESGVHKGEKEEGVESEQCSGECQEGSG